ncbi:hypothetical protein JYU34_014604 [Plutella xylostella]|uniref:Calphotin-like n=1 Tax=Plutella xylostella TaxID=51655 RepID=A0ABQ7Q8Q9_PLUXY|nr:hypothetical protein JYU34_014604 [Plutella xylostella]
MKFLIAFALIAVASAAIIRPAPIEAEIAELQQIIAAIQSPNTDPATAAALEAMLLESLALPVGAQPVVGPTFVDFPTPDGGAVSEAVSASSASDNKTPLVQIILNIQKPEDVALESPVATPVSPLPTPASPLPTPAPVPGVVLPAPTPITVVEAAPSPITVVEAAPSPITVVEAAPSPITVVEAAPSPITVVEAAPSPITVVEAAPSPITVVEAAPSPITVVEAAPLPITVVEGVAAAPTRPMPIPAGAVAVALPEYLN